MVVAFSVPYVIAPPVGRATELGSLALLRALAKRRNFHHTSPMQREFNVVIERDSEGFYVGSVPELIPQE